MTTINGVARGQRYQAFEQFLAHSKDTFERLRDHSETAKDFDSWYTLCITPGGRAGGLDRQRLEVFFGARPYDTDQVLNDALKRTERSLIERGATLEFVRNDTGHVHVYLMPARAERTLPEEDVLILKTVDASKLLSARVTRFYFALLISYMQKTSLDGAPTYRDGLTVHLLRFFCRRIVDDREQRSRFSVAFGSTIKWVVTVGFSGLLLAIIQNWGNGEEKASADQLQISQQQIQKQSVKSLENIEGSLNSIKGRLDEPLITQPLPVRVPTPSTRAVHNRPH